MNAKIRPIRNVSLSTIYKTLDLLKEKKLINEIEVERETRFDVHTDEHVN